MKTFIYTLEKRKSTYGWNFITRIYSVENNAPDFIMEIKYNSGMYRGHESEVFNALCKNGDISPEIAKLTYQPNYFGGDEIAKHVQIFELS